jgi:hypothetical protein
MDLSKSCKNMYLRQMIRKRKESNLVDIFLFHGWALSPTSWNTFIDTYKENLPDSVIPNTTFHLYNRGYFSDNEFNVNPSQPSTTVIVTHSLGLHFVPLGLLHKADYIFVLSGFMNFHKFGGAHSKRIVNKMIEKLQSEPFEVLKEFYKNMFYPEVMRSNFMDNELAQIRVHRLQNDLNYLNDNIITQRIFSESSKIFLLHGDKDLISSSKHTLNWMIKMNNVSGRVILNAGHFLPMTHPQILSQYIIAQIDKSL